MYRYKCGLSNLTSKRLKVTKIQSVFSRDVFILVVWTFDRKGNLINEQFTYLLCPSIETKNTYTIANKNQKIGYLKNQENDSHSYLDMRIKYLERWWAVNLYKYVAHKIKSGSSTVGNSPGHTGRYVFTRFLWRFQWVWAQITGGTGGGAAVPGGGAGHFQYRLTSL